MVVWELDDGVCSSEGFSSSVLELGNEVGVALIDESVTDVVGHEDVVDPHVEASELWGAGREGDAGSGCFVAVGESSEVDVELDRVEQDTGKGETESRVLGEVKSDGNVELGGSVRRLEGLETIVEHSDVSGVASIFLDVLLSDELVVDVLLAFGGNEGQVSLVEVSVMGIDGDASNLEFELLEQDVANVWCPSETGVGASNCDCRQRDFEQNVSEKISGSGDLNSDTTTEIGDTRDGLLNRFNGEDLVSAVDRFEEGHLGVLSEPLILWASGHDLSESSRHVGCKLVYI